MYGEFAVWTNLLQRDLRVLDQLVIQNDRRKLFVERSEYCKLKLEGLHRDHPPAYAISNSASVGVKNI